MTNFIKYEAKHPLRNWWNYRYVQFEDDEFIGNLYYFSYDPNWCFKLWHHCKNRKFFMYVWNEEFYGQLVSFDRSRNLALIE